MSDVDNLAGYYIAPQHGQDLSVLDPYIIEGVAYSPNKMSYAINYADDVEVYCKRCDWTTITGELPYDSGVVIPDMCPDCAKSGEIGHVRKRTGATTV